jgi:phosphoglycolate phosphatase
MRPGCGSVCGEKHMDKPTKRAVLFDFDGVILDSFRMAFETCLNTCPDMTEDDYRSRFEGNIMEGMSHPRGHSPRCNHDFDFYAAYGPRLKEEGKLFPGLAEAIESLAREFMLFIVSSSLTSQISDFLEGAELRTNFTEILGSDAGSCKTDKIQRILRMHGICASDSVFVTDTSGDVLEARRAGVKILAVTWGYHSSGTLCESLPLWILDSPQDVPRIVREILGKSEA